MKIVNPGISIYLTVIISYYLLLSAILIDNDNSRNRDLRVYSLVATIII